VPEDEDDDVDEGEVDPGEDDPGEDDPGEDDLDEEVTDAAECRLCGVQLTTPDELEKWLECVECHKKRLAKLVAERAVVPTSTETDTTDEEDAPHDT
jgi:hypothetical protein